MKISVLTSSLSVFDATDVRQLGSLSMTGPLMKEMVKEEKIPSKGQPTEKVERIGEVSQVIGAVVDVRFGKYPLVYSLTQSG